MTTNDLHFHAGRQNVLQMDFHQIESAVGLLVGDEAEGEFGRGNRGKHGLGACTLVAAGQTVDFGRGANADTLDGAEAFLAGEDEDAGFALVIGFTDRQGGQRFAFRSVEFGHIIIESGHSNPTAVVVQARQHSDEGGCGIHDRAAENAGVQIGRRAAHDNLHRRDATQALGQSRISLGDHPGIRDGDDVAAQLAAAGADEVIEVRASDFFFAFDQENEVHRQSPFLAQ